MNTPTVIAVDFQRRIRAPHITLATPPVALTADQEADMIRRVRAICAAKGVPECEHPFVCARAMQRYRSGDSADCVHAWARDFARTLATACRNNPQPPKPAA